MSRRTLLWLLCSVIAAVAIGVAFLYPSPGTFIACAMVAVFVLGFRDLADFGNRRADRQETMRRAAERLDFEFRVKGPLNVLGWSESFELTRDGLSSQRALSKSPLLRKIGETVTLSQNVLQRSTSDRDLAIFDYLRPSRRHEDASTVQTVCAVRTRELNHPYFALFPATLTDRIRSKLGWRTTIRDGYRVVSNVPEVVAPLVQSCLPQLDGEVCLEAGEGYALIYRPEKQMDAPDLDALIDLGTDVASALSKVAAESGLAEASPSASSAAEDAFSPIGLPPAGEVARTGAAGASGAPESFVPDAESPRPWQERLVEGLTPERFGAALLAFGALVSILLVTGFGAVAMALVVMVAAALMITALRQAEDTN